MGNVSTTGGGYDLVWVTPRLIDKIAYSKTATVKMNAKLAGSGERLYVDKIVCYSPDATDTNNIIVSAYIVASTSGAEGAATTTTVAIGDKIGGAKFLTKDAGDTKIIPVDWMGDAGEDLIYEITVAAGTPTIEIIAYYKLIT